MKKRLTTTMATQPRKRALDKAIALRKVHVSIPTARDEDKELEADLRHTRCFGLLEKSWRVRCEKMVRDLVTENMNQIHASSIQGRPNRWNAEL